MTPVRSTSQGKYISRVRGLFWTHCRPIIKSRRVPADIRTASGRGYSVLTVKVSFCDDSVLEATEKLIEDSDGIEVVAYSYLYKRQSSGFFFQYEMEQEQEVTTVRRVWKPQRHLHVGALKQTADCLEDFPPELREHDGPHFRAPLVTLDGVLATIIANYFHADTGILDHLDLNQC